MDMATVDPPVDPLDSFGITTVERGLRALCSGVLLGSVLLPPADGPTLSFALSTVAIYLLHTALLGLDPVYALARHLRIADRLQVWLHTVAAGALLPLVVIGDVVSALTVFFLSSLGGFFATAAIVGRDAVAALTGPPWRRHRAKTVTAA